MANLMDFKAFVEGSGPPILGSSKKFLEDTWRSAIRGEQLLGRLSKADADALIDFLDSGRARVTVLDTGKIGLELVT